MAPLIATTTTTTATATALAKNCFLTNEKCTQQFNLHQNGLFSINRFYIFRPTTPRPNDLFVISFPVKCLLQECSKTVRISEGILTLATEQHQQKQKSKICIRNGDRDGRFGGCCCVWCAEAKSSWIFKTISVNGMDNFSVDILSPNGSRRTDWTGRFEIISYSVMLNVMLYSSISMEFITINNTYIQFTLRSWHRTS